jgi:hypothetical protein
MLQQLLPMTCGTGFTKDIAFACKTNSSLRVVSCMLAVVQDSWWHALQARLLLPNDQYADEPPMGTNERPRGVVLGNVTQAKNGSAAFRELRVFAEPGESSNRLCNAACLLGAAAELS